MLGHDQSKWCVERAELLQPIGDEALDRGDQRTYTLGHIGHTKSPTLLELEESTFRFVRHSVR